MCSIEHVGSDIFSWDKATAPTQANEPCLTDQTPNFQFPQDAPKNPSPHPKASNPKTAEIYDWIRQEISANRGTELQGTLNPDVLPALFHRQAQKWKTLASDYFTSITESALLAMSYILQGLCPDIYTLRAI